MESLFVLEKLCKKFRKFYTRKISEIFSENFVLEKMLKNAENFVIKLPGWNRQKILKVGVSLCGTFYVPGQVKKNGTASVPLLDSLENLAFNGFYFCIRDMYRSLF